MQRRADQGGRCAGRSHGDELFDCRDSSTDAHLHGGTRFAEPQEQFHGSGSPASPDAGKIEQQQTADTQVENLLRQPLQTGCGPVRALRQAWHAFKQVQAEDDPAGIGSIEDSPDGVRTGSGLEADHDRGVIEIDQRVQVVLVLQPGIDPEMHVLPGEFAIQRRIGSLPRDGIKVGDVELPQVKQVAVGTGQIQRLARGMQDTLQRPIMGANSCDGMDSLPVLDVKHWDHAKVALEHGFLSSTHNLGS
jgi:hypothetical protein